eukprot:scaffold8759_cov135-Isochrysis_galbana.AAC.3
MRRSASASGVYRPFASRSADIAASRQMSLSRPCTRLVRAQRRYTDEGDAIQSRHLTLFKKKDSVNETSEVHNVHTRSMPDRCAAGQPPWMMSTASTANAMLMNTSRGSTAFTIVPDHCLQSQLRSGLNWAIIGREIERDIASSQSSLTSSALNREPLQMSPPFIATSVEMPCGGCVAETPSISGDPGTRVRAGNGACQPGVGPGSCQRTEDAPHPASSKLKGTAAMHAQAQ